MLEINERADEVRERCRTFRGFIPEAWQLLIPGETFKPNWHVDCIADHLQAVHAKEIQRIYFNLPPGMMKSVLISVLFPAWEWTRLPWIRFFSTSYEAGYARRDSRRHRDLVLTEWYQTLWKLPLVKTDESEFENVMKGGRKAVPFRRLTSGRGNRLIVDDPHSVLGAESDVDRDKATLLFRESASSRLNDQETDAIIVVMQRLHPNDLCGVIDELELPYVKVILPMEYVRSLSVRTPWCTDPRTEEGELLHPNFMGREKVEEKKVEVGDHAWMVQYQQTPQVRDGSFFFHRPNVLCPVPLLDEAGNPRIDENGKPVMEYRPADMPLQVDSVIAVADTATKVGKKRDGTGVTFFGYVEHVAPSRVGERFFQHDEPHGYVLDWDITQISANVLIDWLPGIIEQGEEWAGRLKARAGFLGVYIEDKDSGQILIQEAERLGLKHTAISGKSVERGKEGRAISAGGYVRKHRLLYTREAWDKTTAYKGRVRNHSSGQVLEFRAGHGTPTDEDELFDCFCYGALLMFGDQDAT